jgi:hypothetical protein
MQVLERKFNQNTQQNPKVTSNEAFSVEPTIIPTFIFI